MQIDELTLYAADLGAQSEFYIGTLELPAVHIHNALAVQVGRSRLLFRQAPEGWQGFYHIAFNIPENNFKQAKAWLAERSPLLTTPDGDDELHFDNWDADSVYFLDPAGNILELIARHRMDNSSEDPFDSAGLLQISEIGIVADDVPGTAQLVQAQIGPEQSDPPDDTFMGVGDGDGLLITVKRGRLWLPDRSRAAEPAPVEVVFSGKDGGRYRFSGPPYEIGPARP